MNNTISKLYLNEVRAEASASQKCLERIPESVYDFKPHEKSMTMGYLSLLVAEIPKWITAIIREGVIDFTTYQHFPLSTSEALLNHYEENLKEAEWALLQADDDALERERFYLKNAGVELFSAPKLENIGSTINHWVHHRGQLTVYMRLCNIAVPSIYGPSADERTF